MFAAASLKNALDDADAAFTKATGVKVVGELCGKLRARQADRARRAGRCLHLGRLKWMDYVAEQKLIKTETRVNLLGNRLVLIAPKDSKLANVKIEQGLRHRQARRRRPHRGCRRESRAGRALRQGGAGKSLGAWAAAEPKLAQAENVRATLAFVARGETPLGIVYETDAKIEPKVKIVGVFPDGSHPPVTYPVAATAASKNAAGRALSRIPAHAGGQGDLREIRLQLPGAAEGVIERACI